MHLKSTAGCRISILIFLCGHYKYPMTNCQRTAKFFLTGGLDQMYCPGLYLTLVSGWDSGPEVHSRVSHINYDS